MSKVKVTIRQLNGALSAMQIVKIHPDSCIALKKLIQLMLENKTDYIMIPEDKFSEAIVEMAKLNENLADARGR